MRLLISSETRRVLFKQWTISRIPLAISVVWAVSVFAYTAPNERSPIILIREFFTALFFAMYFVTQYLRTAKDLRDSTSQGEIQTSLSEVRESINALRALATERKPTQDSKSGIPPENTTNDHVRWMIDEATRAVENGFVLAGLTQAGVAFEQAIRNAVANNHIDPGPRATPYHMLKALKQSEIYDPGTIAELLTVWNLRNQLVHLDSDAAAEIRNSPDLINYFRWAINLLDVPKKQS